MKTFIGKTFQNYYGGLFNSRLALFCGILLVIGGTAARNIETNEVNHETVDNYIPPMLNPAYTRMTTILGAPVYGDYFSDIGYNVISSNFMPRGLQPVGAVYNVAQYGGVPMTYSPYGIGCYQD